MPTTEGDYSLHNFKIKSSYKCPKGVCPRLFYNKDTAW